MEFDELKQIWDSQNNKLMYGIDEKALHNRILVKKRQAFHITNFTEVMWVIVYLGAGSLILGMNILKDDGNISMSLLALWMVGTALYVLVSRIRRLKRSAQFDRSMHGDLNHAISVASYQVRLSRLGMWGLLPFGILTLTGIWEGGKSIWIAVGILVFIILTSYAAGWEHRFYKGRKRELETLKARLENG